MKKSSHLALGNAAKATSAQEFAAAVADGHDNQVVKDKLKLYHEAKCVVFDAWREQRFADEQAAKKAVAAAMKAVKDALKELKSKPVKGKGKA